MVKKKVFRKKPAKLTKLEREFVSTYVKKGSGSYGAYVRVLRSRWWLGRNSLRGK